jgi:hypothetical protein
MSNQIIIVAPHADDEIIGCHEVLHLCRRNLKITVMYPNLKDFEEAQHSSQFFGFYRRPFSEDELKTSIDPDTILYFPDPIYELHPEHRIIGAIGVELLRKNKRNVVFYSTSMNAPYIHETVEPSVKREDLDNLYPSKSSLWQFDHKYFLFEGYTKWYMTCPDL